MRVNYKSIIHYLLVYLLISWYSTGLVFGIIGTKNFEYFTLFICFVCTFVYRKCRSQWVLLFSLFVLLDVVIVRYTAGGEGIDYVFHAISGIWIAYTAYSYNKDKFIERLVKCICFFATISIVLWGLSLVVPELMQKLTFFSYVPYYNKYYTSSVDYNLIPVTYHGALFYVMRTGNDLRRNNGIFNEPGLYQMVLNTALYFVLFFPERLSCFSERKIRRIAILLIVTILTTQSTTGYLSMGVLVVVYLLMSKKEKNIKLPIWKVVFLGLIVILADFLINGDVALIARVIGSKITIEGMHITFTSSGMHRVDTFGLAIASLLRYPLGAGNDNFAQLLSLANKTSSDGAALMAFGAKLGIQLWLILIFFYVRPVYKNRKSFYTFIAAIFMYINTTLGQSDVFYPILLILAFGYSLKIERVMRGYEYESIVGV